MNINGFIWSIADDVLHHVYDRTKYRDIILPMTVIRRLNAVLEPTRAAVLARKAELDTAGIPEAAQGPALDRAAGQAFHNRSPFTLRQLLARPNPETQKADFEAYLDGFSENVREGRRFLPPYARARSRGPCRGAGHTANGCAHGVKPRLGLMSPRRLLR